MAKTLFFHKLEGAGNDFILNDNRSGAITNQAKLARRLCERKHSIGADGLIFVERSPKADVAMRIFNPDGSEAEMCGNGVRCLAKFAVSTKIVKKTQFSVQTKAGILGVHVSDDTVKARMLDPMDLKTNFLMVLNGKHLKMNFLNTGVPHAVQIVDTVDGVDVNGVGRLVRTHSQFKPRGTNCNFVAVHPKKNSIDIRTYERGVEAETLACGTGSTAGALVSAVLYGLKSPVQVRTVGGEMLKIFFLKNGNQFSEVYLEGKIKKTFEGRVDL